MAVWAGLETGQETLSLSEKSLYGPELNRGSGNGEEGTLWRDEKWAEPAGLCA